MQQYPKGCLYLVPTPIGNLADMSLRAIHVLSMVDAVACEDTRVTGGLLRHLGLHLPLIAVHEHNESQAAGTIQARLEQGERIALVTDAGTPAISDPGARVVHALSQTGIRVMPLPGPNAVATAVSAAGDIHGQGFDFLGFVPASGKAREDMIGTLHASHRTTVCFEAPHRINDLLQSLSACGDRLVTVCRELTKQFETIHTARASTLSSWMAEDDNRSRGEFVVVLHSVPQVQTDDWTRVEPLLTALLEALPLKQAVALVSEYTGMKRNAVYERALTWKAAKNAQPDNE